MPFSHDRSTDRELRLADGRRMAYSVFGDPDGTPVISAHGGLLCRFDVEPVAAELRALGVRLLSPDRPGIGRSDRQPGRRTADWADDVEELLDAEDIEHAPVIGWSLGADYAMAVAAKLSARVPAVAIVAGGPPLDDPSTFRELNRMDRVLTRASVRAPLLAHATFASIGASARWTPRLFAAGSALSTPGPDGRFMREHRAWLAAAMAEGARQPAGLTEEYQVSAAPWGFELDDIRVPTHIHQGSVDEMVPPVWAERLRDTIADAALRTYPGEGHLIGVSHRAEIVADLLDLVG